MKNDNENKMVLLPDLSFKGGYRTVYRQAQEFYKHHWRGHEKGSPAFNGEIITVTNKSFKHVVGKISRSRYIDVLNRLNHFPNAKQIIETATFIFEIRDHKLRHLRYYSLIGQLETGKLLKVIISENLKIKNKSLLTVFDISNQLSNVVPFEEKHILLNKLKRPIRVLSLDKMKKITGRLLSYGNTFKKGTNILIELEHEIGIIKNLDIQKRVLSLGKNAVFLKEIRDRGRHL